MTVPRIGVVGGGVYGTAMLKCFAGAHRQGLVTLVALADLDENVLKRQGENFAIAGYQHYQQMFAEAALDAVAVATPDHLHAEVVLAAAAAGLHVLAQKPLDTDVTRARKMIDTCAEHNVMLFVDFHKRFDPAHQRLKQEISAGKLGPIQYGYVCMEDKIIVPSGWLRKWAASSSPSWFIGVHFYDLVWWLLDSQPVSVFAQGHKGKLTSLGIDTWDSVCSRVTFANGATFSFDISWILPDSFPSIVNQQIRVVGQEGIAEVDSQDRGMFCATSDSAESQVINAFGAQEYQHPVWGPQMQGYTFSSMLYFLELIALLKRGEVTLSQLQGKYPDGESAMASTRIGAAIDRSLQLGQPVTL
ncbi:Gfo/Idh/MocA family protein [Rahnella woolbedingensis]|uniref:Gfo/Idh/MocA family oxidoreductase n=1 Tax=Rahnella woolbedingensis TaxID=1510574 RepID=A0A419N2C7_9GAMM|nr:Gfo/Idh/MocA family oxidoreductase [Rahnella woolbedingensis]RJT34213.1 gfo/Idh/MocA family oxidoreductase [Rahnella woolbedingensis]